MAYFRDLPDPNHSLYDSRDFIFNSLLARRALESDWPNFSLVLSDLIDEIYRLTTSCHLAEFTDHGLVHLCSLVDRVSRWTLRPKNVFGEKEEIKIIKLKSSLVQELSSNDAAILLIALLIHDMGMLSQKSKDLPDNSPQIDQKAAWNDVAAWVRATHVKRLEKLSVRVIKDSLCNEISKEYFLAAIDVASAHERWPWEWGKNDCQQKTNYYRSLAAIVAVADILDEDASRCDTVTLIQHRHGTFLNAAHWLRHLLTEGRILIKNGVIDIHMVRPPETTQVLDPVFGALRNHFRLIKLYEKDLNVIGAGVSINNIVPATGSPAKENSDLSEWGKINGFETESVLCYQLLRTFMKEARKDFRQLDQNTLKYLTPAALEDVDLSLFHEVEGKYEARSEEEKVFYATLGKL